MTARRRLLLGFLPLLLLVVFVADVATGSVSIPLFSTLKILLGEAGESETWARIILQLRLPRAVTAGASGAALAVSGLMMQTLFRNPLAGPFVLGISSGASLGVALVVLTAGGAGTLAGLAAQLGQISAAVAGATLVLLLVVLAARYVPTLTLLILGVLFGYAASALVSILLRFGTAESVQSYVIWMQGEFGGVTWTEIAILAPLLLLGLVMAGLAAKPLNALLLGETYARSMGVAVERSRLWLIGATALMAGAVTAYCGPIAFLGVAVPHLGRGLLGTSDHRTLLPVIGALGASLALAADLLSQLPGSAMVLPLNAITSLLGAPVVIWVIIRRRRLRESDAS